MRLLMITRKVDKDDGLAGFTYNWIKKISQHVDKLYVMCLEKGNDSGLPENVSVYSLGKEKGKNRLKEFIRFHKLAGQLVKNVDGVFAHQNPEYGIMVAPWTKIYRKKLIAWYTHKQVSMRLKVLNFLAYRMITASPESFLLPSKKLVVLHHGIDTDMFGFEHRQEHNTFNILSVSRISATKKISEMIDVIAELKDKLNKKIIFKIVGVASLGKDKKYLDELKDKVNKFGLDENIEFLGSVANWQTPKLYQEADLFLNFSATGSLDKTVLEAMSCGCIPLVTNVAFESVLKPIHIAMYLKDNNQMVDNILQLIKHDNNDLRRRLRKYVEDNHNLDKLSKKIIKQFNE